MKQLTFDFGAYRGEYGPSRMTWRDGDTVCASCRSALIAWTTGGRGSRRDNALRQRDQANRDAEQQRKSREWAESQARGANIAAGKAKAARRRLEHRVNCGVCPHCRRTVKQMAAHIKSKHPDVK